MNKIVSFIKTHKISTTLLSIGIVLLGWWTVVNVMPHPLGDKMEYLGKEDYGNVFGFDSHPYSVYYYGTDMSEEEIIKYFKKATLNYHTAESTNETLMNFTVDGKEFYLTYYKKLDTFESNKKAGVSLTNSHFIEAQKSL